MLNIDRADDIDPGIQQILRLLVAFALFRSRRVRVREFIYIYEIGDVMAVVPFGPASHSDPIAETALPKIADADAGDRAEQIRITLYVPLFLLRIFDDGNRSGIRGSRGREIGFLRLRVRPGDEHLRQLRGRACGDAGCLSFGLARRKGTGLIGGHFRDGYVLNAGGVEDVVSFASTLRLEITVEECHLILDHIAQKGMVGITLDQVEESVYDAFGNRFIEPGE